MQTPYQNQKGLTLIEILVVMAIIGVILSFGMTIDLNAFRGDTFRAEESTIVSALERARSHAMANMFESPYGVCYIAPNYVIFRENDGHCVDGISTNELIPANTNIATASGFPGTFPPVVFNQLAGTTTGVNINLTDGVKSAIITINNEGTINW